MKVFKFILPSICLVALFMYFMFSNDKRVAAIGGFSFIIGLSIYYLKALLDAFIVWIKDKEDGDQVAILEYIETYCNLPSNTSRGTSSPGYISASFRIHSMLNKDKDDMVGEIISLSGNIKGYDFVVGNKYKATMRVHSKKLISIEDFMSDVL